MSVGKGVFWKKTTTDQCCQLDMSDLSKKVDFIFEQERIFFWSSAMGSSSIKVITVPPDKIRLQYTITSSGQQQDLDYLVRLDSTPCNYGGKRRWFICPSCNCRCRILYRPPSDTYFLCRVCYNLTYTSQQEGKGQYWAMTTALTKLPEWQAQLRRARSPKKRLKLLKKINSVCGGMQGIIDMGKNK
ncbi:MAG: hypothetical protein GY853_10370 [PVC group bacterium]|nr:hypothetical protein [PVC group bacterium]